MVEPLARIESPANVWRDGVSAEKPPVQTHQSSGAPKRGWDLVAPDALLVNVNAKGDVARRTPTSVLPGALEPLGEKSKDLAEGLPFIEEATRITDAAIAKVYETIRPGMTERDVARVIEGVFAAHGHGLSFPTIAVSGPNTRAIHGTPSDRVIEENDIIMIDLGARYEGPEGTWCSDVTRTFFVGQPTPRQQELWEVVREAQRRGLAMIRPGVRASDVDKAARDYIRSKGYSIPHAVGHGVGRRVHEPPTIDQWSRARLEVGDVITVEPGIYSRKDGFGVRIEDTVVVTEDGFRFISHAPYQRQP